MADDKRDMNQLLNPEGEVVLQLENGYSLRSGATDLVSGEWVRLVDPEDREVLYWDQEEWATDPALVMGAIINAAAWYATAP